MRAYFVQEVLVDNDRCFLVLQSHFTDVVAKVSINVGLPPSLIPSRIEREI